MIKRHLIIESGADITELEDNKRGAISILKSFPETKITIRAHSRKANVKNPEYLIDGFVADRKGIKSENGIASGFKKAIEQGCKAIVIDLDKNMHRFNVKRLSTHLQWRRKDFENGIIERCYVIYNDKAVVITRDDIVRERVTDVLETLKP